MDLPPAAPPLARRTLRGLSLAGLAAVLALLALWLLLGAAQAPAWAGGSYGILQTYPNPTPAAGGEEFGYSLAYLPNSNQLVVGARSDPFSSTAGGQVFLLNATTGVVNNVLHLAAPVAGDHFGLSVSAALTTVVVGAPRVDVSNPGNNDGAVYLYDALTGALVHTYLHPAPFANDEFGAAVAIISDTIVVGVPKYNAPSQGDAGQVYLCRLEQGDCPTVIPNPSVGTPAGNDFFGLSVIAIPGGFAVGAPFDGSHGTVYLYAYDGVTATVSAVISTTTSATGDEFGRALALVGNKLLIGAANSDIGATNTGAAYLYSLTGTPIYTFTNPIPHENDHFGGAVSGDGPLILIGAADDDDGASDAGLVHLYSNNGTTYPLLQTVNPTSPATGEKFGFALAAIGGDFAVSAVNDNLGAAAAGAVYRVGYVVAPPTATPGDLYLPLILRP